MMHFTGFKSKAALKEHVKLWATSGGVIDPVMAEDHLVETSMFGDEYKPGQVRSYCVCLDHPKRTKFAEVTVDEQGRVVKVA